MKAFLKRIFKKKSLYRRIKLAAKARDCRDIPKVKQAGKIINHNGVLVQIMHNGVKVLAGGYHGAPMSKIIKILKGHHEPQEEKIFHEILKHIPDQAAMIEVGCYWAYYSLWFSHDKAQRRNYLMEPVQWKRLIGQLNFALNGKNIEIDPLYIENPDKTIESSTTSSSDDVKEAAPVTLDNYISLKNLDKVDVLHADIQGAEIAMLESATLSLDAHKIDYIFISTHDDKHARCLQILQDKKYTILAEHKPEYSSSADGLIVAAGRHAPHKEIYTVNHY